VIATPTARFTAWSDFEPDHPIEEGDDLDALLGALVELAEPDFSEDVAVFENGNTLVAVVLPDGTVIRYRGDHQ
jgi:hypothetical protein